MMKMIFVLGVPPGTEKPGAKVQSTVQRETLRHPPTSLSTNGYLEAFLDMGGGSAEEVSNLNISLARCNLPRAKHPKLLNIDTPTPLNHH